MRSRVTPISRPMAVSVSSVSSIRPKRRSTTRRSRGVRDGPRDGLANPPRRVCAELEAAAPVEFLDGAQQAEIAFLDQVDQRHATVRIAPGDADHQAQVRVRQRFARDVALSYEVPQ